MKTCTVENSIEQYAANCLLEYGVSVVVWAGVHHDRRTVFVRVDGVLSAHIYHIVPLLTSLVV